jgi:hypothetical protein
MEPVLEQMEAQLKVWRLKIDRLAVKTDGVQTSFDTLLHIDELKALHAIAQSKFIQFKAAGDPSRARLETEMTNAWKDLEATFKKPIP